MPKRMRQQTQDEGSDDHRKKSLARNRQRRHRAGLTEEQLDAKRERDRVYKARSRARKTAKLASPTTTPSPQPTSQGGSPPVARPSGSNTSRAAQLQDDYLDDDDTTSGTDEYRHHEATFAEDDRYGVRFVVEEEEYHSDAMSVVQRDEDEDDTDSSVDEMDVFGDWMDEQEADKACETPPTFSIPDSVDAFSSTPPRLNPPPLPTSSTSNVPDRYKDLVTGVLGVQVSHKADTVSWTSGQTTVLPYLEGDGTGRSTNALQRDRDFVADLAHAPEALPSSDLVVFLPKDMAEEELLQAVREALSRNKTVVIRGYIDTKDFELTEEQLQKKYSIFVDRTVEPQDMRQRVQTFSAPHVKTTLREFLSDINNPDVARMLLDLSFPQSAIPPPFERLDDGMAIGWAQTNGAANFELKQLPADIWSGRMWGILHHAGVVSYVHRDADGAATYCIPMAGVKSWVVLTPNVSRDKMTKTQMELISDDKLVSDSSNNVAYETIHLYPGDLLIMPPGQLHAVYTPIASMCRGGHFFNLDAMHLTELSRSLDSTNGTLLTNQVHAGTLESLCRLVLALPFINSPRKLYKNSLIALCGMVMYHTKYTSEGQPHQTSNTLESAQAIAKEVLQRFAITGVKRYEAHLRTTGKNPYEKGEEVSVFDLLQGFRT